MLFTYVHLHKYSSIEHDTKVTRRRCCSCQVVAFLDECLRGLAKLSCRQETKELDLIVIQLYTVNNHPPASVIYAGVNPTNGHRIQPSTATLEFQVYSCVSLAHRWYASSCLPQMSTVGVE